MKYQRIKSLEELKAWNASPTKEKPIVMEWFMDWFFEELIDKKKDKEAKEAMEAYIEFAMKCEGYDREMAERVTASNLSYYSGYAGRWETGMRELFKKTPWYVLLFGE